MKKIFAVCAMLCLPFSAMAAEDYAVTFKTQGDYQFVRDLVQTAIEGQGLKITNTNKIAEMLERTGRGYRRDQAGVRRTPSSLNSAAPRFRAG